MWEQTEAGGCNVKYINREKRTVKWSQCLKYVRRVEI